MGAVELASSFATIVGLLFNYVSDERNQSEDSYKEFLQWLSDKRHEELRDTIIANVQLSDNIKQLLQDTNADLNKRFAKIDAVLASVAAHMQGVNGIASAIRPDNMLSLQAISILRQVNDAEGSLLLQMHFRGTPYLQIMDGKGGSIAPEESRFFNDDMRTLCEIGFLRPDTNKRGENIFYLTRQAVSFLETVAITDGDC